MYSKHNEEKSVIAERFIRTLKTKINKYMTSISENVYIDKLYDLVNECSNTCHRTKKMNPVDVKDIDSMELHFNDKDLISNPKVGDNVRISKYKNIFAEGYISNWSEEVYKYKS